MWEKLPKQLIYRALIIAILPLVLLIVSYLCSYYFLAKSVPNFEYSYLEPNPQRNSEKSLPFFELMSPLPSLENTSYVPHLEYRKGPPKRYFSKISYLLYQDDQAAKEKIEFLGRRTQKSWSFKYAPHFMQSNPWSYASFLHASIEYAYTKEWPEFLVSPSYLKPIAKLLLLHTAKNAIDTKLPFIYVMDQAGVPAFLYTQSASREYMKQAKMRFYRKQTLYEVRLTGEDGLHIINPLAFFQSSFLVKKKVDAMQFLAEQLADVSLKSEQLADLELKNLQWPLLLLGAKLSLEPKSITALFHFAGLNAILFKDQKKQDEEKLDLELLDRFRNNVLVANQYGKDIAPNSQQSSEIARLARAIRKLIE